MEILTQSLYIKRKEMTEERKQELRQLLEEAMQSVIIEAPERYKPISVEKYREDAKAFRESYRPDLSSVLFFYRPSIQDEEVKSKLFNFIKEELADYILQNESANPPWNYSICPANLAIHGTNILPCPLDSLLEKLLEISIASGTDRAILALDKCARETSGTFQEIVLLQGPRLHPRLESETEGRREIHISDGIRLVLFPLNDSEFPPYLFDWSFNHVVKSAGRSVFRQKTVLIIDHTISPLFCKSPTENENQFEIKTKSAEFPNFDVEKFCQAFSLVSNYPVEPVHRWSYIDQDELFNLPKSLPIIVYNLFTPKALSWITLVDETHIEKIKNRYKELTNLPSDVAKKLQIPIDRWIKSKAGDTPEDKIIDLCIALESLYLRGIKDELNFRLGVRAAWFLGEDKNDRKRLLEVFKKIYDCRSTIVHGEGLTKRTVILNEETTPVSELITEAQDLCQKSIVKILKKYSEDGKYPDDDYWKDLILGEETM